MDGKLCCLVFLILVTEARRIPNHIPMIIQRNEALKFRPIIGTDSLDTRVQVSKPGVFENCGNSTFHATWEPEPMLMSKPVTAKGDFTFPKDFINGTLKITIESFPPDEKPITCKQITKDEAGCKKGKTITFETTVTVPELPSTMKDVLVKGEVYDHHGYQFICAKAKTTILP